MKDVKVSVVICAYTMERLNDLCEAVQSLREQTLKPFEIIVAIDHNDELYDRLKITLPATTKIIKNQDTPGVSVTRNVGILAANGEFVACMDDDAQARPDWLENIVTPLETGIASVVGGKCELFWKGGERPVWFAEELDWIVGGTYKGHPDKPTEVRNVSSCSMALSRETLRAAGYFDERIGSVNGERRGGEEAVFCLNIKNSIPEKQILYEPKAVVLHKVHVARAAIGYVIKRSYQEGVSKAVLERLVGSGGSLTVEGSYLKYLVKNSVPRRLATLYRPSSFLQLWSIVLSVSATIAGYAVQKFKNFFPDDRRERRVAAEG